MSHARKIKKTIVLTVKKKSFFNIDDFHMQGLIRVRANELQSISCLWGKGQLGPTPSDTQS